MKKLFLIALTAIICSCGSTSSPEAVVKAYFDEVISLAQKEDLSTKGNYRVLEENNPALIEKLKSMQRFYILPDKDRPASEKDNKVFVELMAFSVAIAKQEQLADYQIISTEQIDDQTAKVTYKLLDANGQEKQTGSFKVSKENGEWKIDPSNR